MENTKKGVVTAVTPNGTYQSQYGLMYKYEVAFDNGDAGEYSSKSGQQNKFVVGQPAEYTATETQWGLRVKPVQAFTGGGGFAPKGKNPETEKRIVRMNVLQRAVDLVIAGHVPLGEVTKMAERFESWVTNKDEQTPPQATQPTGSSDLPF